MAIKDCLVVRVEFPDKPDCCGSCHNDADDYDYDLAEIKFGADEYVVCCTVGAFIDEKIKAAALSGL